MIFRVYRSINDGNLVPLKDVTDATTYTDTDLLPNTKFGYAISYFDGDTESKMSDVLSVKVGDVPITGVTLVLKKTLPNSISKSWQITAHPLLCQKHLTVFRAELTLLIRH